MRDIELIQHARHYEIHEIADLARAIVEARRRGQHYRARARDAQHVAEVDRAERSLACDKHQLAPLFQGDDRVYVIRRGLVRAEQQKPKSRKEKTALESLVQSMFANEPQPAPGVVPTHAIDELMLVSSWFRRHPKELKRTKPLVA